MAAILCDVVRRRRRRRRRRWAHAPVIHAASHFDHKKRVAWVPISMHTCGSFFYNYGAPLGGPWGRRSSATRKFKQRRRRREKMNLYFTSEIRGCLHLFSVPMALKTCLRWPNTVLARAFADAI